jgi:hypothetical protein
MKQILCMLAASAALAWGQDKPALPAAFTPLNLELTVYLVSGLTQAQASDKDEVPQDLASVLQQLQGVFTYKRYKLIEAVTLRGRNMGGANVEGGLPDYTRYVFRYARARISPETPHIVHLDGLVLKIVRGFKTTSEPIAVVETDLDIKDGQKTVVGKTSVNGPDAIFLVIVPKVVE